MKKGFLFSLTLLLVFFLLGCVVQETQDVSSEEEQLNVTEEEILAEEEIEAEEENLTPETGTIFVTSSPSEASVYIDKNYEGTTPINIRGVAVGSKDILIYKTNYSSYKETVQVVGEQTINIFAELTLLPPTGTGKLYVASYPSYAHVYGDGSFLGLTPSHFRDVKAGNRTILITKWRHLDYTTRAYVEEGKITSVVARLTLSSDAGGNVYATSVPSGAEFYIDGFYKGLTPLNVSVFRTGSLQVRFTKEGYNDYMEDITV